MRWLAAVLALAGCAKLLDFEHVATPLAPTAATLAAGGGHTCVIRAEGTLWCWGDNEDNQVGLGLQVPEIDQPSQVGTATWTEISAANNTTCGITTDGELWCWGDNSFGQLGTGDTAFTQQLVQQPGHWQAVSAGELHTCAIDSNTELFCWGYNNDGELGDGSTTDHPTPGSVGRGWIAVAAGGHHTCAIKNDGKTYCWGDNGGGQCGIGTSDTPVTTPTAVASTDVFVAIAAGTYHVCGVTSAGHVRCWGHGDDGQLGVEISSRDTPGPVLLDGADASNWVGVVADGAHACAWNRDGTGYCWGDSSRGELGIDGAQAVPTPTEVAGPWVAAGLGEHHACWVDAQGALSCRGARGWGQLGNGGTAQISPIISSSRTWGLVSAGDHATCALDKNRALWCGGDNQWGALATGDRTSHQQLVQSPVANMWQGLAVGQNHACGTTIGLFPFCWGVNSSGETGLGTSMLIVTTPTQVTLTPSTETAYVITASDHTCIRDYNDQAVHCWGPNYLGALGDGTTTAAFTEANAVSATTQWDVVATGLAFSCGLAAGSVWCWGANGYGQLGTGTQGPAPTPNPVKLTAISGATELVAGVLGACAADASHTWSCWGYVGGMVTTTPTPVAAGHTFTSVSIGAYHACGIDGLNKLWCWGANNRGQIGAGMPLGMASLVPVQINGNWKQVTAGWFHTCGIDFNDRLQCWGSDEDGALLDGNGWTTQWVPVDLPPL